MAYEIITHDGKRYALAQKDEEVIARLASKLELIPVTLANGKIEYFSKGTVARLEHTGDISSSIGEQPALGAGTPELTDEQRERNIQRIREMKSEFLKKKSEKSA